MSFHHAGGMKRRRVTVWDLTCVLVIILLQVQALEPEFGEMIPNVTVAIGRETSLPCVVENLGKYRVAWVHVDRQMILTIQKHVITRIPRFSIKHDEQKTWFLHISSIRKEDKGYYMCQVNTKPMKSILGYVEVVVPPTILDQKTTHSQIAVKENTNITLTCKADGYPEPLITWRREDNREFSVRGYKRVKNEEGDVLPLSKVSRTDMGVFLCIASNGVPPIVSKRIKLEVEFPPMIWIPNQLMNAPLRSEVTIECHTESYPLSMNYWTREDEIVAPSSRIHISTVKSDYKIGMYLKISNINKADFGEYICVAKNSLGETKGSIKIYEMKQKIVASSYEEYEYEDYNTKFQEKSVDTSLTTTENDKDPDKNKLTSGGRSWVLYMQGWTELLASILVASLVRRLTTLS